MPPLSRGFLDSHFDIKTSKGNQRSQGFLDAFATIFAGSGDCVAVGVIRDLEKRVVQMIIGGNGNILASQRQQINDLYMGLKGIAAAAERVTARQFHSTHNVALEDSPPGKAYQNDLREFNPLLLSDFPLYTFFTIYYIWEPNLILVSGCKAKYREFHAMVIQYCIKKIARRCKKYGKLLDRVDDYLTPEFQERCGIESYIVFFQQLKPAIENMCAVPARRKNKKWMDYVLTLFQKLHFARKGINFIAVNGIYFSDCPGSIMYLLKTYS